jgi:hypothetical protein
MAAFMVGWSSSPYRRLDLRNKKKVKGRALLLL